MTTVDATATALLSAILSKLDRGDCPDHKWPDRRGEYWPLCPFHPDTHHGSFHVSVRGYYCHECKAGGGLRKLARHLGIALEPDGQQRQQAERDPDGLTLADYARAKHLSPECLAQWGVTEHNNGRGPYLAIPYRDASGRVVAERRRFALRRGQRDQRFAWRTGDKPLLYGLWRLAEFQAAGDWVLLVEGESDCHAAWKCGLPVLGVPGAQAWRPEWAEHLRGFSTIYAWQEPDRGGEAFVRSIAASIPNLRVLRPPAGIKDLSEALILGHDLRALIEQLRAQAAPAPTTPTTFPLTEQGNAERLLARHGQDLLYAAGRWYVWDGTRWRLDDTGEVRRRAVDTVRAIYEEAAQTADDAERKAIAKWALRSESRRAIEAMIELAWPGVPARLAEFDTDPWLLNCANGTLDLRAGQLRPHDRANRITRTTGVAYDPDAWQPGGPSLFNRFLNTITGGDADLAAFLQRVAGYALTGDTGEEALFFVHGPAATGKSTFIEALRAALGEYAAQADFETFLRRSQVGGVRNDIARLAGARLVASIEVEKGRRLAEGLVKTITGGDTVAARFLYREAFEFVPAFKLFLVANDLPHASDDDSALWRRIVCVPFPHVIPPEKRDPQVKKILRTTTRAEVLAWAVQGCLAWQREGLRPPDAVKRATQSYRDAQNPLADFFAECCVFGPQYWAASADLWDAYQEFEGGRGSVTRREFNERLRALGCKPATRDHGTQRGWRGIGLLTSKELGEG